MRCSGFALALALTLGGCVIGAPPGWSGGDTPSNDTWTFPLLDPLADGRLLVPVYLDGRGPFIFAIDPDAPVTVVDQDAVLKSGVPIVQGVRLADWNDVTHHTLTAEIPNVRIGTLTISLLRVIGSRNHAYDGIGRRVYGIIGRDLVKDSVVFGFDRDRGIAWISTNKAFVPPPGAAILPYFKGSPRVTPRLVVHKLVHARVNGLGYDLHLDLAHVSSQLRLEDWPRAHLAVKPASLLLVDEAGTQHESDAVGLADAVAGPGTGTVTRKAIGFVPFMDKRWWTSDRELEGTLALDFFRPYAVAADWQDERFYLSPREGEAATRRARLSRWGAALPCPDAGCIEDLQLGLATDQSTLVIAANKAPQVRGKAIEVVLGATAADGTPLPDVYLDFPASIDEMQEPIDTHYLNGHVHVIDVNPFPHECKVHWPCLQLAGDPPP